MANNHEDEYSMDLDALRRQVMDGNFALRPHALRHAVKEGFTEDTMLYVVLLGNTDS